MIDFIIPCHKKDFPSLELSVNGIKNNISNVNEIYIISKENPQIEDTIYISEEKYLPYVDKKKIKEIWLEKNPKLEYRSKWIYQQFLKLLSFKVIPELTSSYVVVDSDTIFLNDICFDQNKFYYSIAEEYHIPYLNPIKVLLGINDTIGFSCISHHMVFNKTKLNQLIDSIEKRFSETTFVESVLNILDYNESSCFSEWDLYANYMLLNHPNFCENKQLKWKNISFIPTKKDLAIFKLNYDFVSCHAYDRGIE
ncbi:MAG: hypothetical protein ACO25K_05360 [Candidatus Fonsibacter ubiquis]